MDLDKLVQEAPLPVMPVPQVNVSLVKTLENGDHRKHVETRCRATTRSPNAGNPRVEGNPSDVIGCSVSGGRRSIGRRARPRPMEPGRGRSRADGGLRGSARSGRTRRIVLACGLLLIFGMLMIWLPRLGSIFVRGLMVARKSLPLGVLRLLVLGVYLPAPECHLGRSCRKG